VQVCVHNSHKLRNLVLKEMHNVPYVEHPGYQKTIETLRGQYFWSGMKKNVVEYISKCMECLKVKVEHRHPARLLQPLPIPKWKWEVVTMNFITKLPRTVKQHDTIVIVVDQLTKVEHYIPMKLKKAANIAKIYMKQIATLHGVPCAQDSSI
jgi:hypothetical protein